MAYWLSREEQEAQQQRKHKIEQLKSELRTKRSALKRDVESHQRANAEKWEYLQVSDKNVKKSGSLSNLGQAGWELVSASAYSEGPGMGAYTLYIFKRRLYDLPDKLINNMLELGELEAQINKLERQ